MNGKLIWNARTNANGITELNAKDWKAGVYIIDIRVGDKLIESVKFIKQ